MCASSPPTRYLLRNERSAIRSIQSAGAQCQDPVFPDRGAKVGVAELANVSREWSTGPLSGAIAGAFRRKLRIMMLRRRRVVGISTVCTARHEKQPRIPLPTGSVR
jgi:hypothetical protein